jgi:voltage-gated potassium channel
LLPIPNYIDAIYWCITTITTVGYGDISPVSDLQKILTMIAMFLGVAVYGFVIGNVASLLSNIDRTKASFLKQMEDINSYLSYKSVPKRLKHKVHNYYQYIWHNRMVKTEKGLLSNLPDSLKTEILLNIHRQLIEKVPFFKNTDKDFLGELVLQLKPTVFLPCDYVFKKGDVGNCMYFIGQGSVNVISENESTILATLKEGDYLGEIALIKKVTRTRSVKANDYCFLYALEKKNFDTLLEKYPKFKKHIHETIHMREKLLSDANKK